MALYLIYLTPLNNAVRMVWMLAGKCNEGFTFLKFPATNYTSTNNNYMLACHFKIYIIVRLWNLKVFERIVLCCHLAYLLCCKLLKLRKQVYQQRDLYFLYQPLNPMQLIPEIVTRSLEPLALHLGTSYASPGTKGNKAKITCLIRVLIWINLAMNHVFLQ